MADKTIVDLGWLNNPLTRPQIDIMRRLCEEQDHRPIEENHGPANRGLDHRVVCVDCGYVYHYDSSD